MSTTHIWLLLTFLTGLSVAQQQFFRVVPHDVSVGEGGIAVIHCSVGNRVGRVQWTKDGLTLGYSRAIPGNPRYTTIGNEENGEYNLQITNVTLEDDANYECQVGPASYNRPIRKAAHLHVLLPPKSIEIVGHQAGSRVDIRENEEVELTCKVANAKPKADIVWFRKDSQFVTDSVEVSEEDGDDEGRKTVISTIKFRPTSRDNSATYACEAQHPALHSSTMRVSVVLSVMYPPGPPEIQGYIEGETIRMGQTVSLTCVSYGGNPLATITWYRNDEMVDMSYTTSGRESRNMFTFVAASEDNNAKYSCEARNEMSVETMTAQIVLAVQFAPESVTIEGPDTAKVNETLNFKCETANSNPPATVQWVVDGRSMHATFSHSATSENGGWITSSELSVRVHPNDRNKMISCYAVNQELGETIQKSHMVSILYPPGAPNITGITSETELIEEQVRRMTCISMAGNPLADLKWFRGDEEIPGTVTVKGDGDYSKSDLTIVANRTDNGKEYTCKASNDATPEALLTSVHLRVLFKPSYVKITVDPEEPKAGQKAILTCESGSSNPTARIVWRYKNVEHPGVETSVKKGEYGGNITTNMLEIEIKPEDHGAIIICEAINEDLTESVHNAKTLSVKYKPRFSEDEKKVFTVEEGGHLLINLTATANPPEINYEWSKNGKDGRPIPEVTDALPESRAIALPGGYLNISQARREDAGMYKVKATNSEGKKNFKFQLDVHYPPKITHLTNYITVNPGENAELVCSVDANPIKIDTVKWLREGFDFEAKTRLTNVSNINFYLTVINVTEGDAGQFTCQVNNGIGETISNSTFLLVRHKPKIDKSPALAKSASDKGQIGKLVCKAQGAPDISFMWSRQGRVIQIPDNADADDEEKTEEEKEIEAKYEIKSQMIDRLTWQSELYVKNVNSSDYGNYDCIAQNEMGLERYTILLNVTSRPDPPSYLKILNVTYNSVNLTWTPGFNGGFNQTFKIRYRREGADNFQYVDVSPLGTDTFEVQDLKVDTKYSISIVAFNSIGASPYTSDIIVSTKNPFYLSTSRSTASTEASVGAVIGAVVTVLVLLVLNAFLVLFCIKRKTGNKSSSASLSSSSGKTTAASTSEGGSSTASTKSATIEMYVGSSTGYNDTMSGETMSSISEKSGSYISEEHHHHHVSVGGHGGGHHHRLHHVPQQQQPQHLMQTTEFDEEDLRVPPLPQPQQQPGRTYLVDHHPQLFEPPANYATMPRQPPGLTSTFSHSNTLGGRGGNNVPRISTAPHQFEEEERRRQAYIQSLGNSASLDQRRGGFRNSEEIDEHTTAYYGGEIYNGSLYVVGGPEESGSYNPRSNDNYGYLPTPPPPPPPLSTSRYLYPEHAGHLV